MLLNIAVYRRMSNEFKKEKKKLSFWIKGHWVKHQ